MQNKEEVPQYYFIEIEALVPTTIKYKVLAKTPEEALDHKINYSNCSTKPQLAKMKKVKTKVTEYKTSKVVIQK